MKDMNEAHKIYERTVNSYKKQKSEANKRKHEKKRDISLYSKIKVDF